MALSKFGLTKFLATAVIALSSWSAHAAISTLATFDLTGRGGSGYGAQGLELDCGWGSEVFSFTTTTMKVFSDGSASISGNMRHTSGDVWGLTVSLSDPEIRRFSNANKNYVGSGNGYNASYMGDGSYVTADRINAILTGQNSVTSSNSLFSQTGHYFLAWDELSMTLDAKGNDERHLIHYGNGDVRDWDGMFANNHVAALDFGHKSNGDPKGITTDFWTKVGHYQCVNCIGDHKGKGSIPREPSPGIPLPTTAALFGLGLLVLGRKKYQLK